MGSCYSITETQQLVVQTLTTEIVINGPQAMTYIGPLKKGMSTPYSHLKNIHQILIYFITFLQEQSRTQLFLQKNSIFISKI